jgi:hypothetical protein
MSEPLSAVVAGSKGFVDAMGAHLKMRFGAAPRVARDAGEALAACGDKGGLLVLEYAGSSWLEAVRELRGLPGRESALSIVAAVGPAQATDVQPLKLAGVDEVVSWQGRVDPVVWAVDRIMGRSRGRQVSAAPPKLAPAPDEEADNGLDRREIAVDESSAVSAPVRPVVPIAAAKQVALEVPALPWPGAVPSAAAAEALLLSVVAGRADAAADASHLATAERVLAAASELEQAALSGGDVPIDPVFLRSLASLRLRLDLALSSVPAAGCVFDQATAEQLLADVDGVLAQVKALAPSAPPGVMPALDPTRLAIVDGGVQLAGALSQLVPEGVPEAAVPKVEKKPTARVLSNEKGEDKVPARRIALWVVLALALAGAAAFHANHYLRPPKPSGPGHLAGSPAGSLAARGPGQSLFIMSPGGRFDQAELEKFKAEQELKGNTVQQVAPGTLVVVPGAAAAAEKGGGR